MRKIKIGVLGAKRGEYMIKFCEASKYVELVAICERWKERM